MKLNYLLWVELFRWSYFNSDIGVNKTPPSSSNNSSMTKSYQLTPTDELK